tara:strand:- start:3798 stop:4169 length:372 start_codon:yes stop_codon:yes gene_type:complete
MPDINVTLPTPLNFSVEPGDIAYYIPILNNTIGGFQTNQVGQQMVEIGPIITITFGENTAILVCDMEEGTVAPTAGNFIFFGKDRAVNEASILGYYGEFVFKNNSKQKAEMFSTACEMSENSK